MLGVYFACCQRFAAMGRPGKRSYVRIHRVQPSRLLLNTIRQLANRQPSKPAWRWLNRAHTLEHHAHPHWEKIFASTEKKVPLRYRRLPPKHPSHLHWMYARSSMPAITPKISYLHRPKSCCPANVWS